MIFTKIIFYPNILHTPFVFDDYSAAIDTETTIKHQRTTGKLSDSSAYA